MKTEIRFGQMSQGYQNYYNALFPGFLKIDGKKEEDLVYYKKYDDAIHFIKSRGLKEQFRKFMLYMIKDFTIGRTFLENSLLNAKTVEELVEDARAIANGNAGIETDAQIINTFCEYFIKNYTTYSFSRYCLTNDEKDKEVIHLLVYKN